MACKQQHDDGGSSSNTTKGPQQRRAPAYQKEMHDGREIGHVTMGCSPSAYPRGLIPSFSAGDNNGDGQEVILDDDTWNDLEGLCGEHVEPSSLQSMVAGDAEGAAPRSLSLSSWPQVSNRQEGVSSQAAASLPKGLQAWAMQGADHIAESSGMPDHGAFEEVAKIFGETASHLHSLGQLQHHKSLALM